MPLESIVVAAFIVTIFACFAAALAWGDRQTRLAQPAPPAARKHRPF